MTNVDFFCTNNFLADPNCFSPSQFYESNFQAICPSNNCIEDCLEPGSMYDDVSQIMYSKEIPLYAVCTGATNITRQLHDGSVAAENVSELSTFFPQVNMSSLERIASTTTTCLIETCLNARYPEYCQQLCSPAHLLLNSTTPSLQGQQDCLTALCSSTEFLPFADQDIIGIGVSVSYVVQGVIAVIVWIGFSLPDILHRLQHKSAHAFSATFTSTLIEANEDFHKAQCYFDISLSIAALFNFDWPFLSDPVNAYVLMPVMANAVLSPTITYLLIYRYGRRSWYIDSLTFINWLLASVVIWGLQNYIRFFGPTAPGLSFEESLPQGARHLSDIDACGGSSALNLCTWATGISPIRNFFNFSYTSALKVPNTVAAVWSICTLLHLIIFYISISNFIRKIRGRPLHSTSTPLSSTASPATPASQLTKHQPRYPHTGRLGHVWDLLHTYGSSLPVYLLTSSALFVCVGFEAALFHKMLNFGYVDLSNWSFGQIVAVVVWVPPIVEFIEAISVDYIDMRGRRIRRTVTEAGLRQSNSDLQPLRLQSLSNDENHELPEVGIKPRRSWETGDESDDVTASSSRNTSADTNSPELLRPPRRRTTRFHGSANGI